MLVDLIYLHIHLDSLQPCNIDELLAQSGNIAGSLHTIQQIQHCSLFLSCILSCTHWLLQHAVPDTKDFEEEGTCKEVYLTTEGQQFTGLECQRIAHITVKVHDNKSGIGMPGYVVQVRLNLMCTRKLRG